MLVRVEELRRVAPDWLKISFDLKRDPEADAEFGWMLEMWGYSIACGKNGLRHRLPDNSRPGALQLEPSSQFGTVITARATASVSSPAVPTAYMYHYTFTHEYSEEGVPQLDSKHGEWSFDKRNFQRYLPLGLLPPPRCALEAAHVLYTALHDAATSLNASGLGGPWPADPAHHHDTAGRADDPSLARHAATVRPHPH